ncbi:MAG: class I SAM-dependent methyltransferase, partial [Planctomycetia bacterium]
MTGRGNFGERQDPGADDGAGDWGFLAHRSIYDFAGRYARGRRCLEIGCGTGYGSRLFLEAGATSLVAIDKDAAGLDALRARHPAITFVARDLDL